jgi:glycosyltransferase involved in cell wall biosynthesis
MKIVHVAAFRVGGAGHAAWKLHKGLLNAGVDSHFISFQTTGPTDEKWHAYYTKRSVIKKAFSKLQTEFTFRQVPILGQYTRKVLMRAFHNTTKNVAAEYLSFPVAPYDVLNHPVVKNADVINLHWVAGILDYTSFFSRCTKPVVWTLHDLNPCRGILHYDDDRQTLSEQAKVLDEQAVRIKEGAYRSAGMPVKLVSPSVWLAKEAAKSSLMNRFSMEVIPNGVEMPVLNQIDKRTLRLKLGLPTDRLCLLFVATSVTVPRKGFSIMMEALALQDQPFHLTVIGADAKPSNAVYPNVMSVGALSSPLALTEYYQASDALVLPSLEDNLPNVMLEAMACGLPVLAFAVGGIVDGVECDASGYLAQEKTAESLAEAIRRFLDRPQAFDTSLITKLVSQKFSIKAQADAYMRLYSTLVDSNRHALTVV